MRHLDAHAACLDLRVLEHLVQSVDRAARHAQTSQAVDPDQRAQADAATVDLARRVEGRLVATGVQAYLTGPGVRPPEEESERAEFANRANAQALAKKLGGHVSPVGAMFRVRTGPFATRGQAEAALAKVRAAGYSDARVYTAG